MKGYLIVLFLVAVLAALHLCFLGCSAGGTDAGMDCTSTDSTAICGEVQYEIHR